MRKGTIGILFGLMTGVLGVTEAHATPHHWTVRVVTPFPTGHILADTAFKFKEILEDKANDGRFTVTVATGVLNEQTINPQMTNCDPSLRVGDVMLTGGQPIQDWAPSYFFFNGPYVIRDYDHFLNVWDSHLGDEARDLISANGNLASISTVYRGFRQFTSNEPINGPADFNGLVLRLPPTPDWVTVWSSLGVTPKVIPLTGIYNALATGEADASEGDLTQIQSLKLYEVQDYLTLTNHLVGFGLAQANECYLDTLGNGDANKLRHALQQATDWGTAQMQSREAALLAQLSSPSEGMIIVNPDAAAIRAAAEPAINGLFASKWTVTTWSEVLSY